MPKRIVRLDANTEILGLHRTPQGFLKGSTYVTRTGVFFYMNTDGSTRRELRHPDEVFNQDSLDSLKQIPITDKHPKINNGLVDSKTAKELTIGMTGETVNHDETFVDVSVAITTNDGISSVEAGRKELSLGYTYERDETPGTYENMDYDYIQRNIRYNHLAIVDRGRAGKKVRLQIATDGIETVETIPDKKPQRSMSMPVKINLDGIEYEVPPEVKKAHEVAVKALDAATTSLKKETAEKSKIAAAKDTAEDLLKQEREKFSGENLAKIVANRVELEKVACDFLDEETAKKLSGMSDIDVKKQVVAARFPDAALDKADDSYVNARFDTVVELGHDSGEPKGTNFKMKSDKNKKSVVNDSTSARDRMIERLVATDSTNENKE